LPTFKIVKKEEKFMEMIYYSDRGLYMFAKALIEKTFEHFDKNASINYKLLKEDGTEVLFLISENNDRQ